MDTEYKQPETGLGSVAETNRLLSEASKETGVTAPIFSPIGAISSEALSGSERPYTIPPTTPSTLAEGTLGVTQSYLDRGKLQKEQEQKALEAQNALATEKQGLGDLMKSYLGIQGSKAELEEKAGIKTLTDTADEYRISLEESQRAQMNEIKALEGQGLTDIQKGQRVRELNRRYAIDQAELQFAVDIAERRLDRAQRAIDRKIELQLEPLKTQMEFTKFFYEENKELFNKADERAFQAKIKELDNLYAEEKETRTAISNIQLEAAKNGVVLPSNVVTELNKAKTITEATSILARNGISLQNPLEREKQELELQKLRNEINPQNTFTGGTIDQISNVLSSNKIGQGTKTTIGTILGVINAVEDMAKSNSDGKFTGFNPLAGFTTGFYNTFRPGQPGKPSFLKRDETIANETYLEGINLKIQQWASGAALTEAQTAQVKRMTPVKGDTDRVVKRKLNELTNFMNQQIKGALMAEGITYEPEKVDLFRENQTLAEIFSDVSTTTPAKK